MHRHRSSEVSLPRRWRHSAWQMALALLICALGGQRVLPAEGNNPPQAWTIPDDEQIRSLLAQRMEHNGVGVVVGVIEPAGRRMITYGRSGSPGGRALDGDAIFQIGSISKTLVGLLLADMVLKGEVKLDDPAERYLPAGVRMPRRGRPITLADLSQHVSGLPRMPTNFDLRALPDPIEAYSLRDLHSFLSSYTPTREPGESFEYSNLGVSLLGLLLGHRAGMEYEELVRERVLIPLGMTDTSVRLSEDQQSRLVPGHQKDLLPVHIEEMRTLYPSGSMRSSATDLLKLLATYLAYPGVPLKEAAAYQLRAPTLPLSRRPQVPGEPQQGLGMRFREFAGRIIAYHNGDKDGYRNTIAFDLERRIGVVILENARTDDLPIALAAHLLTGAPLPPVPPPVAVRTFAKVDAAVLEGYAGDYRFGDGRTIRVARKDDHLLIDDLGNGPEHYYAKTADEFGMRVDDPEIVFHTDPAGRTTGMSLFPGGRAGRIPGVEGVRLLDEPPTGISDGPPPREPRTPQSPQSSPVK